MKKPNPISVRFLDNETKQITEIAESENINRSDLIRRAVAYYLRDKQLLEQTDRVQAELREFRREFRAFTESLGE
jgi:metal-responsive CopG/Arc/MetJ family transcriptional regulator